MLQTIFLTEPLNLILRNLLHKKTDVIVQAYFSPYILGKDKMSLNTDKNLLLINPKQKRINSFDENKRIN